LQYFFEQRRFYKDGVERRKLFDHFLAILQTFEALQKQPKIADRDFLFDVDILHHHHKMSLFPRQHLIHGFLCPEITETSIHNRTVSKIDFSAMAILVVDREHSGLSFRPELFYQMLHTLLFQSSHFFACEIGLLGFHPFDAPENHL